MFEVGKIYNRRSDIHAKYKGQQYGGISTPVSYPYIFIFTGDAGSEYGYIDTFDDSGMYRYTGEGQEGDMTLSKGNLAIYEHQKNKKQILLFESVGSGDVRFLGYCNYIFHHIEKRPDKNAVLRDVIVFHLDIINTGDTNPLKQSSICTVKTPKATYITKPSKSKSLNQLRDIALSSTPTYASIKEKKQTIQYRSLAIKLYAKKRANGICEGCRTPAPFETKNGPYLEVHHLTRLADGGADLPKNVIALCPICHRRAHYSLDYSAFNDELKKKVAMIESKL